MTDFYSVLKTSIIRRDLRSRADRLEVYKQARKAMIRKLWSFNPPLAEDEIDTRIGLFDAAVERIEGDLELTFVEGDSAEARRRRQRVSRHGSEPEPHRQPMVYEGYDDDADYMPAFGGRSTKQEAEAVERTADDYADQDESSPMPHSYDERWSTPADEGGEDDPYGRAEAAPTMRSRRHYNSRNALEFDDKLYADDSGEPHYGETDYSDNGDADYRELAYRRPRSRARAYPEPPAERRRDPEREQAYESFEEPDNRRQAPAGRRAAQGRSLPNRWDDPPPVANGADTHDERYAAFGHRTGKRRTRMKSRGNGNQTVRILTIAVAGLTLFLVGFNAYVFVPIIFGSESRPLVTSAPPPKIDDQVPAAGAPALSATKISNDSATAVEIPTRNLDVAETLVVFDGRDPTVFDATSDNPIQFDGDAEGGFARISSASSAAGARAVVGPGLAERLAGQTIRVTLLARSSQENGAATLRFAYQSGLAVSHWQTADLSRNYGSYGMIWRVPAAHGSSAGDYLLIEPGIPGDGTSTDIRSIRIDILDSK